MSKPTVRHSLYAVRRFNRSVGDGRVEVWESDRKHGTGQVSVRFVKRSQGKFVDNVSATQVGRAVGSL